jgi:hypothetical protein
MQTTSETAWVEDVTISNCSIEDLTGRSFRNAVHVSPSRGAIVRRVAINNLSVRARGLSPAVQHTAAVYLHLLARTNAAGIGATIAGCENQWASMR